MYRYDTRLLTCFQQLNRLTLLMPVVRLLACGSSAAELSAQSSATPKNVYSPLVTETYPGVAVTTTSSLASSFSNENNVIGDLDLPATYSYLGTGTGSLRVTDQNATSDPFPEGSYAGFRSEERRVGKECVLEMWDV